jgi:hypothetical protein
MAHRLTGLAAMPPSRSHRAPFFTGHVPDPLKNFLKEYEILADGHELTDREKVETITRYIPVGLQDYWESLDGYATGDWDLFRESLEATYPNSSAGDRHSKHRLYDYIRQVSRSRMRDEDDVLELYLPPVQLHL